MVRHLKNFAAFAARFLKCVCSFWGVMYLRLRSKLPLYGNQAIDLHIKSIECFLCGSIVVIDELPHWKKSFASRIFFRIYSQKFVKINSVKCCCFSYDCHLQNFLSKEA